MPIKYGMVKNKEFQDDTISATLLKVWPGAVARSEACPLGMQAATRPAYSFVEIWS